MMQDSPTSRRLLVISITIVAVLLIGSGFLLTRDIAVSQNRIEVPIDPAALH